MAQNIGFSYIFYGMFSWFAGMLEMRWLMHFKQTDILQQLQNQIIRNITETFYANNITV